MAIAERTIDVAPGSEIDRLLSEADGEPLVLVRDGVRFRVQREDAEPESRADYDPDRVRRGLRESAGALSHIDREAFKAEMRLLRGHDSHDRPGDE